MVVLVVDRELQSKQMHCMVLKSGTGFVISILNALVSVYVNFACLKLRSCLMR